MTLRQLLATTCAGAALALTGCGPDPAPDVPPAQHPQDGVTSGTNAPPQGKLERHAAGAVFNPAGRMFLSGRWHTAHQMTVETLTDINDRFVTAFVEEPGFGGGRRMVVRTATPPMQWNEIVPDDGDLPPVPPDPQPNPVSPGRRGAPAGPEAALYSRSRDIITFAKGDRKHATERVWTVTDQYLLGLANGAPKVLLHKAVSLHTLMKLKDDANTSARKAMPQREPDAFETKALEMLKAGDDVVTETQPHQMRMLGAIRAKQNCLACHSQANVGDVLGAFTYTLTAHSDATPDKFALKETAGLTAVQMTAVEALQALGGTVVRHGTEPIREVRFRHEGHAPAGVPFKNAALAHLAAFPELTTLDVAMSKVDDAGVAEIVKRKNLKKVDVTYSAITKAGIAKLKEALPGVEVVEAPVPVPAAP